MADNPSKPLPVELSHTYDSLPTDGLVDDTDRIDKHGINDDDTVEDTGEEMESPQTPSATSIHVDETPVAKRLGRNLRGTRTPDRSLADASELMQRPSSTGGITVIETFSFMPANIRRPHCVRGHQDEKSKEHKNGQPGYQNIPGPSDFPSILPTLHKMASPVSMKPPNGQPPNNDENSSEHNNFSSRTADMLPFTHAENRPNPIEEVPRGPAVGLKTGNWTRPDVLTTTVASNAAEDVHSMFHHSDDIPVNRVEESAHNAPEANEMEVTTSDTSTTPEGVTRATLQQNSSRTTAQPLRHDSRISKAPRSRRTRPVQCQQSGAGVGQMSLQRPSEEDLLFLLMSRARETNRSMQKLQHLEAQNVALREQKAASDAELEQAVVAQIQNAEQLGSMNNCLQKFKEKYYKLKKWAFEANQDCETLQQQASGFQRSLSTLKKERDDIALQLTDIQSSYGSARDHLEILHLEIQGLKSETQTSTSTMNKMDGILMAQGNHLKSERQRCRKLEAHIAHLEHERNKQDTRLNNQHQQFNESLEKLSEDIGALQRDKSEDTFRGTRAVEFLSRCLSLLENESVTKSDFAALKEGFGSTTDSLNNVKDAIAMELQDQLHNLRHELQSKALEEAENLFSVLRSENNNLTAAKAEIAVLERVNEHNKENLHFLNSQQKLAVDREKNVQNTIQSLDGGHREKMLKHVSDLETIISSLTIRWQSANSQLANCEREKNECQDEIMDLRVGLSAAFQEVAFWEAYAMAEVMATEEYLNAVKAQAEQQALDQTKLNSMNGRICILQNDLDQEIQKSYYTEMAFLRLGDLHAQAQKDLEKSNEASDRAVSDRRELQLQLAILEENLEEANKTSNKLTEDVKHLEDVTSELADLKQKQMSFEHLMDETLSQQREIADQAQEIRTLQEQIIEAKDRVAQLKEPAREKAELAEENIELRKETDDLRKELAQKVEMERELHQKSIVAAELESALSAAEKEASQANELRLNNLSLQDEVRSLKSSLESTGERCQQLEKLNENCSEKDAQIETLTRKAARFEELSKEHESLKENLQQAEEKNASQQQMILTLEGALSNSRLDKEDNEAPRLRRVAHRPGTGAGIANSDTIQLVPNSDYTGNDGSQQLCPTSHKGTCDSQVVIPETQFDTQNGAQNRATIAESDSEMSELSSIWEVTEPEYDSDQPLITARKNRPSGLNQTPASAKGRRGADASSQRILERPPSSSYGSQSDQMLLDQVSQSQLHTAILHDKHTKRPTLDLDANEEDTIHVTSWNRTASQQQESPRRLRSEPQAKIRQPPAFSTTNIERGFNRESTPAVRERHQPNSAAKRRVELEDDRDISQEHSKRLKRTPANLEARSSRGSTPGSTPAKPTGEQNALRPTDVIRKSSSIVGTNAPVPGKSQRASKGTRKGSRQDKYSNRFASLA